MILDDLSSIYVVGGRQKKDANSKEEWHRFAEAVILRIDVHSGEVEECVTYVSPPEARPDSEYSCVFKAATLENDMLYVCTQTELLGYRLPDFEQVFYVSHPCFNDVHHVRPTASGTLLVANTGLDMVVEITREGELKQVWNVLGQDPWSRFSPDTDYRKVDTTKPHQSHPNYVFELGRELWVTRFEQKDAISLSDPERRIAIDVERPHDGVVFKDQVYFTSVDGHVIVANRQNTAREHLFDLNTIAGYDGALGWCRGIAIVEDRQVFVGFSRIRPTKFSQNVRWARYYLGVGGRMKLLPTRITRFDLVSGVVVWEKNLEDHGMNAIFSIHTIQG